MVSFFLTVLFGSPGASVVVFNEQNQTAERRYVAARGMGPRCAAKSEKALTSKLQGL